MRIAKGGSNPDYTRSRMRSQPGAKPLDGAPWSAAAEGARVRRWGSFAGRAPLGRVPCFRASAEACSMAPTRSMLPQAEAWHRPRWRPGPMAPGAEASFGHRKRQLRGRAPKTAVAQIGRLAPCAAVWWPCARVWSYRGVLWGPWWLGTCPHLAARPGDSGLVGLSSPEGRGVSPQPAFQPLPFGGGAAVGGGGGARLPVEGLSLAGLPSAGRFRPRRPVLSRGERGQPPAGLPTPPLRGRCRRRRRRGRVFAGGGSFAGRAPLGREILASSACPLPSGEGLAGQSYSPARRS